MEPGDDHETRTEEDRVYDPEVLRGGKQGSAHRGRGASAGVAVRTVEDVWARGSCDTGCGRASLPAGTWTDHTSDVAADTGGAFPTVTLSLPDPATTPVRADLHLVR